MWLVGSTDMQKSLQSSVESLSASLASGGAPAAEPALSTAEGAAGPRHIHARLLARDSAATDPVYVGLIAPNMKGGVIITSTPGVHFSDAQDREKQMDYLAGRLHSGYGAHGIFLKTLAAGLAYSNGLRASVQAARNGYYAERTPEIPQTVKFVVETLKAAERDPRLGEYAVAQVFGETRAAANYETRAEGIANDLADGQPPEQVRKFRESILELRKDPQLADKLFARKDRVHERILPGYGSPVARVADGLFFAIGPDRQLDAWERYLKAAEGPQAKLYRLYGRDFWMP
jgi:hypothetical protein